MIVGLPPFALNTVMTREQNSFLCDYCVTTRKNICWQDRRLQSLDNLIVKGRGRVSQ